jgi:hypothetical protein
MIGGYEHAECIIDNMDFNKIKENSFQSFLKSLNERFKQF